MWCSVVATSFVTLEPVFVGGMVERLALSQAAAGLVSAALVASSALGTLGLVRWAGRPLRPLVVCSGAVLFLTELLSATAPVNALLLALQLVNSVASGVLFGAVNAFAARAERPARLFAAMLATQQCFGAVALFGLPSLLDVGGTRAVFLASAALCLPIAAAPRVLPAHTLMTVPESGPWRGLRAPLLLVLASLLMMFTGATALWAYLERIGVRAQVLTSAIRAGLSLGLLGGLLGGVAAWLLASTLKPRTAIPIALALMLAGTAALGTSGSVGFVAGAIALNAAQVFAVPFYLSTLAHGADGQRNIVVAGPTISIGLILGPLVGAGLAASSQPVWLPIGGAALILLALLLIVAHGTNRSPAVPA